MTNLNSGVYNTTIGKIIYLGDIEKEAKEVIKILFEECGHHDINALEGIRFNNRLKKCLAMTRRKNEIYTMDFNTTFIKTAEPDSIKNVIAHECVHLIPDCWKHTGKFKVVGSQLARYGYTITRTYSDENYHEERREEYANKAKYFARCPQCGYEQKPSYTYSKTMKRIAMGPHFHRYQCCKCACRDLQVIKKYPDGIEERLWEITI